MKDNVFPQMPEWMQGKEDTLKTHLKMPEIDLVTYSRIKNLERSQKILSRKIVYLDSNYWINLREYQLGKLDDSAFKEIYALICKLSEDGRAIFPLSYSIITELLNQSCSTSRKATAVLMHRFSKSFCLRPPHELIEIELEFFLRNACFPRRDRERPIDLVWTGALGFVGTPTLERSLLPEHYRLAFNKALLDLFDQVGIDELSDFFSNREDNKGKKNVLSKILNREKFKQENQHEGFEGYFISELTGGLLEYKDFVISVFSRIAASNGIVAEGTEEENEEIFKQFAGLIQTAYKNRKLSVELPQFYVSSSLHAAVRYDKRRKYQENDYEDIRHAGSALGYCDAFLTENFLSHIIKNKPLQLDKEFDVRVIAKPDAAIAFLESIL